MGLLTSWTLSLLRAFSVAGAKFTASCTLVWTCGRRCESGATKKAPALPVGNKHCWWRVHSVFCPAATAAKLLQSCLTLCDAIDSSPPGSPTPGILQARTLEWVAISFSNAWKWKVKVKSLSHVWLLATPRTAAHQAPPSMGFSRQKYWSGVPLPSPINWWKDCNPRNRFYRWVTSKLWIEILVGTTSQTKGRKNSGIQWGPMKICQGLCQALGVQRWIRPSFHFWLACCLLGVRKGDGYSTELG